jgi:heme A synthase
VSLAQATQKANLWKVALLAFAAMCVQDVFGTVMVIFESRFNAPVAGLFDVGGWIAGLVCAALAIEEIIKNGWRTRKSLTIIGAVSLANFAGTYAGVAIGAAITHHH